MASGGERKNSSESVRQHLAHYSHASNEENSKSLDNNISGREYITKSTFVTEHGPLPHTQGHNHHMPADTVYPQVDASRMIDAPPPAALQVWLDTLEVTSLTPQSAQAGAQVDVCLRTTDAPRIPGALFFSFAFRDRCSPAAMTTLSRNELHTQFMLSTRVPPLDVSSSASNTVSLSVVAQNEDGNNLASRQVGQFTYANKQESVSTMPLAVSKRRASADSHALQDLGSKRLRAYYMPQSGLRNEHIPRVPIPPSSRMHQISTSNMNNTNNIRNAYLPQHSSDASAYLTPQTGGRQSLMPASTTHLFGVPMTRSISAFDSYFPHTPQYSSPTMAYGRAANNSRMAQSTTPFHDNSPTISPATIQRLSPYDTSTLSPESNSSQPAVSISRPSLVLQGDLDTMIHHWTNEESDAGRRLVVFERKQSASTLSVSFRAVPANQHTPGSICVSCIWWEDRQMQFITSVDTIALIESLCGYKFTVPVKNRIRRNLEGFKPVTVVKEKEDTEDIFKVIMGFSNPKPRNIEKHIKVFPWTNLSGALKKIVGKYARNSAPATARPSTLRSIPTRRTKKAKSGGFRARDLEELDQQYPSPASAPPSSYGPWYNNAQGSGKSLSHGHISPAMNASLPAPIYADNSSYRQYSHESYPIWTAPTIPSFPVEDSQYWPQASSQWSPSSQYRDYQADSSPGWTLDTFTDPGLTATPTASHIDHQNSVLNDYGLQPGMQTPFHGLYSPEFQRLHAQYAEDQPIGESTL